MWMNLDQMLIFRHVIRKAQFTIDAKTDMQIVEKFGMFGQCIGFFEEFGTFGTGIADGQRF